MATTRTTQLNIRSEFVRQRTDELVKRTGMTATKIIEEALKHYVPPVTNEVLRPGLVRVGRILVATGGNAVTTEQVLASIDETREGVRD